MNDQRFRFCKRIKGALSRGYRCLGQLERFSYDLEIKTREQYRNNKQTEIERFDWFIEHITMAGNFWMVKRTLG